MLDSGMFSAFRRGALIGGVGWYGVLVIDIGAFTTDFGYVQFNNCNDSSDPPDVIQVSEDSLGIRQLDEAVRKRLPDHVCEAIDLRPASAWESAKRQLYHGKEVAFLNPRGRRMLVIGAGPDANVITEAIRQFACQIVEAKAEFCRKQVRGDVNAAVLTGGGAMIPGIRDVLVRSLQADQRTTVYDLLDPNEPSRALPPQAGDSFAERAISNQSDWDLRLRENQELVRGASAMGGCSLFFE